MDLGHAPSAPAAPPPRLRSPARAGLVLALLYLFLVGVGLLESGIEHLGSGFTDNLFRGVENPLLGLLVGLLATVLVQSSSATTSTIVGLVAAGVLPVTAAVPMVMGANIGTTVTNTIVSLGHIRQTREFELAFSAATMHDFFNVIAVAIMLPLELTTRVLSTAARDIAQLLSGGASGGTFDSPVKGAVTWGVGRVESLVEAFTGSSVAMGVLALVTGITLVFVTLIFITRNMRSLVANRIERTLNAALRRSGIVGILVGTVVTMAVQSSSITTSMLIPLVASGILLLRNAYTITLGANVGTTITALLAALSTGEVDALTIAVTHTLFNVGAIAIIYPLPRLRYLPVTLAERLAGVAMRHKPIALAYTLGMFVAMPLLGILILR
jgi:sodium-dependent phosphate cotransporter